MALTPGTRLGPYEIATPIGVGGMGEVYRATDTNLGRHVAIKVLPDAVAQDTERLARFDREARTLAALNHPNIAAIYGLEKSSSTTALVMELVEGPTLDDRIAQGAIPIDEAIPIAKQIAEALEAAHEQGIIHRDLKPANVKVRSDGTVKVLDFGLAKAMEPAVGAAPTVTQSPTITTPAMTQIGMILGTAAYMSPEQARGKPVDKRADIWAFGCVLYEMLTGRRPFEGDDVSLTLARVLEREPDLARLPATAPERVRQTVRICLQKDLKQRAHDIADVRLILDGALGSMAATPVPAHHAPQSAWRRLAPVVAGLLFGVAVSAGAIWYAAPFRPMPVTRLTLDDANTAMLTTGGLDRDFTLSPDGSTVVYVASGGSELRIRELAKLETRSVASLLGARAPFMAPDGQWVAFSEGATLKKVSLTGGAALTISPTNSAGFRGGTWGPDDSIVFATDDAKTGLLRVSADGGEPEVLTTADAAAGERDHVWPEFLPGGRAVLFTILPTRQMGSTNDEGENNQIAVLDIGTGTRKVLVRGGFHAQYVPTGHLVYGTNGRLQAVPFALDRLEVTGPPVPVQEDVTTTVTGAAQFMVAGGTLVYIKGLPGNRQTTMTWVYRDGREEPLAVSPATYRYPRISPDGSSVAVDVRDEVGQEDVWMWQVASGTFTKLTFDPARDTHPVWTRDGRNILFTSNRDGSRNLYQQSADGMGKAERVSEGAAQQMTMAVAPDGRVVIREGNPPYDLMTLALRKSMTTEPLIASMFSETSAEVSPDGRWLAYDSEESGQREVYVRPFADVSSGKWQVSVSGGSRPVWSRDGRELFYAATAEPSAALPSGNLDMLQVPVATGAAWVPSRPTRVFGGPYSFSNITGAIGEGRNFDISPDGRRFLMLKELGRPAGQRPQIFVVQNWAEELKRLVPTN